LKLLQPGGKYMEANFNAANLLSGGDSEDDNLGDVASPETMVRGKSKGGVAKKKKKVQGGNSGLG